MFGGKRRALGVLAGLAAWLCWPGAASATSVTLGDPSPPATSLDTIECHPCGGSTFAQTFFSPDVEFAPAAGRITSWRVSGQGTIKLRVIESGPEGGWTGIGTSAPATNLEGHPNATSLPIGQGDTIGVDFPAGSSLSVLGWESVTTAETFEWFSPLLGDGGGFREPSRINREERFFFGAVEVLAPVVSSISPPVGGAAGGTAVTITGQNLDGATGVTFGSTPASSFSVDPPSQITAIAPASAAGDVYVSVTGPGGSSEVSSASRYTFAAPPASTTGTTSTTTTPSPSAAVLANPAVAGFSQSASRWRRGGALPHISSAGRPAVGTTFSFTLNEPATLSLAFTQSLSGRRVKGTCIAPTQGNAGKPRCRRSVKAGSISLPGHGGLDKLRFQGRLSSSKTLKPGGYTATITARDSNGVVSPPQSLSFTVVAG